MKGTTKIEIGILLGGASIMTLVYLSLLNSLHLISSSKEAWGLLIISYILIFIFGVSIGWCIWEKDR